MARKVKTEQDKKKGKKKVFIILFFLILLIGAGVLVFVGKEKFGWDIKFPWESTGNKKVVEVKELDNLSDYKYTLTDRDSKYFKEEFEVLKDILNVDEVDEEKYATQVARMFVIDLYTMYTKVNKYDVGGLEYFHSGQLKMFEQKVMDSLYSTMLDDTYGDRTQSLPEVSNVETVSTTKTTYKLGETKVDAYLVKLKITYKDDLGYDKEASVMVTKDGERNLSVVDFQPTLSPKYS